MGFLVSQHGQLGAISPPRFLSISPIEEHAKWRCDPPPPQKGYLSDTCAIPYENKANGCDTPLCDTISKGYCATWGGISHWATKRVLQAKPAGGSQLHRAWISIILNSGCHNGPKFLELVSKFWKLVSRSARLLPLP